MATQFGCYLWLLHFVPDNFPFVKGRGLMRWRFMIPVRPSSRSRILACKTSA